MKISQDCFEDWFANDFEAFSLVKTSLRICVVFVNSVLYNVVRKEKIYNM